MRGFFYIYYNDLSIQIKLFELLLERLLFDRNIICFFYLCGQMYRRK